MLHCHETLSMSEENGAEMDPEQVTNCLSIKSALGERGNF